MTTNYPGAIDSLSNPGSTDPLSAGHAAQHANANDAIEAIEGELGTDPAGASATVKARFGVIEANDWVTTDRIADSQVTSAKILDGTIVNADVGAAAAIAATKVAGTAVTQADTGTVTSTMILDGTVVNGDINAAAAIAATKVAGTAVTQADTGTVTSAMLLNGTIVDADVNASADIAKTKIAGTAVTVADTGTVTSTMILDGTIVNGDINASAAIAATKISGTAVTQGDTGTVTSTMIADATIVGGDIATGTVTSTNLADNTIVNADVNSAAAIDVSKLSGVVPSSTVGNLLTANQASIETDTTGFSAIAGCTIARSTAQAKVGSASLLVTSTTGASGGGAAGTPRATSGRAVTPGVTYTGIASVLNGVGTRTLQLRLLWWDGAGTFISTADGQTATPATWTTLYAAGVAPANAAYVSVEVNMTTVGSIGDTYYLDCLGFWQGAGGLWALPGTPVTNLGFYTDESVGRRLFQWDANNSRWQQTFGDTGWRDVTGSLESGATAVVWRMRRVNNTVSHQIYNAAHGGAAIYTLPAGFNCLGTSGSSVPISKSDGTVGVFLMDGASGCSLQPVGMESYTSALYVVSYTTTEAWPSSLPGAPLGSIPA